MNCYILCFPQSDYYQKLIKVFDRFNENKTKEVLFNLALVPLALEIFTYDYIEVMLVVNVRFRLVTTADENQMDLKIDYRVLSC